MHIISKKKLREFWDRHPRAKVALESWFQVAKRAEWDNFADVRRTFNTADRVGRIVVFDIGGNKYRLIAAIHFNRGKFSSGMCGRVPYPALIAFFGESCRIVVRLHNVCYTDKSAKAAREFNRDLAPRTPHPA